MLVARLAALASRRLGRGGGTALPGLVAERIEPNIVARLATRLGAGSAVITGTNGKTTTARLLAGMVEAAGRRAVHNRSGSNLMRGLAATLTAAATPRASFAQPARTAGVFEVDEATLPAAVSALQPRALAFTNLFRDQLDRYGEVDSIATLWRRALAQLPATSTVVLNADDPSVAALRRQAPGPLLTFGVEAELTESAEAHPADSRWCDRCGSEFAYSARFFWHVGHWRCPGCDDERPIPDVAATVIDALADGTRLTMRTPAGALDVLLPLAGLYNAYNALAATSAALALGLPLDAIAAGLERFTAAFGRQERLAVQGRTVEVLLCKNPAGVNQVLRLLTAREAPLHLLVVLNDDIADGRDVSWIWDVDFELLAGRTELLVASGSRAADIALRLSYAGAGDGLALVDDPREAVQLAVSRTPPGATLHVLPTYTAMLSTREQLAALAGGRRFWQQ